MCFKYPISQILEELREQMLKLTALVVLILYERVLVSSKRYVDSTHCVPMRLVGQVLNLVNKII